MKPPAALLGLVMLGCSDPATSTLRGSASRDGAAADAPPADIPPADVPPTDAPPAIDAPLADAPTTDAPLADAPRATDAAPPTDVPPTDAPAASRVVQLGGAYVGAGNQGRLDALFAVLGVAATRVEPGEATAERLRGAVIVAAFAARPTDWTAARFLPVLEAIRAGAWMLGESFGPWPLHEAGVLSFNELTWSRTDPCVGTFFWLGPDRGETSYFAFAGIDAWTPTSEITPQMGPVVMSYPSGSAAVSIPTFGALLPATRTRHTYLRYVQSYCEPGVNRHPWCVDNARFCNGERGVEDGWVDEFVVGAGRVFNVTTAPHSTASLQWGEVTTRMQVNVVREALRRAAP